MGKKKNGNEFLVQGGILAAAGMISRIIGMIYRIPLLNIMGTTGQGFYEVAYQIYSIALILTSYSMPLAVSKLVSPDCPGIRKRTHTESLRRRSFLPSLLEAVSA